MYPKDTEKWKQFTTGIRKGTKRNLLFCIPKILKNESNSQRLGKAGKFQFRCFVSQRYWKMKAIHNSWRYDKRHQKVVLYPKDTEKWKQFTTGKECGTIAVGLFCIPKILKNESNSQLTGTVVCRQRRCFVSQRYWKMKAIHNERKVQRIIRNVVLYPKDTEKWKQFTTNSLIILAKGSLFCIPKILKNESNSQLRYNCV